MAFTLEDLLAKAKGIVPDNVNIFGAGIPANTKILQDAGLLDPEAVTKAEQQSLFQGLLGAGLGYLAQPKNQGYGSAIPYLAKAYGQGIVASQKPYEQLSQDAITKEKVDEILATRESKKVKQDLTNLLLLDPRVANDPAAKLMAIEKPEVLYTQLNKPRESMFGKPSIPDYTRESVKAAQESNDITKLVANPKEPKEKGKPTFYTTYKEVDGVTYATQNQNMGEDFQGNAILKPIGPAYIPSESGYQGQPAAKQQIESSAMSLYNDKIGLGFKVRDGATFIKAGSDIANIAKEISIKEKINPSLAQRKAEKLFVESGAMKEKNMLSGQFNDSYDRNLFLNYYINNYAPPKKENQSSSPKLSVGTKIIDANNIEATIEELNPDGTVKSVRTSDGKITTF